MEVSKGQLQRIFKMLCKRHHEEDQGISREGDEDEDENDYERHSKLFTLQ